MKTSKAPKRKRSELSAQGPRDPAEIHFIKRIREDIRAAGAATNRESAIHVVRAYYQVQEVRKMADAQATAALKAGTPNVLLDWLTAEFMAVENEIQSAMDAFSDRFTVGRWSKSVHGIGPILSAGLIAHLDIRRAPHVGHIWSFVGAVPSVAWHSRDEAAALVKRVLGDSRAPLTEDDVRRVCTEANKRFDSVWRFATTNKDGESVPLTRSSLAKSLSRRPWSADAKVLRWKVGECLVRASGSEKSFYGPYYRNYKAYLEGKNEAGDYREAAAEMLRTKRVEDAQARATLESGKLLPAHLDRRARLWLSKMFLAHWHHVAYEDHHGKPPARPYALEHLGHADYIPPPGWPLSTVESKKVAGE